jgi:hypothetical protein
MFDDFINATGDIVEAHLNTLLAALCISSEPTVESAASTPVDESPSVSRRNKPHKNKNEAVVLMAEAIKSLGNNMGTNMGMPASAGPSEVGKAALAETNVRIALQEEEAAGTKARLLLHKEIAAWRESAETTGDESFKTNCNNVIEELLAKLMSSLRAN